MATQIRPARVSRPPPTPEVTRTEAALDAMLPLDPLTVQPDFQRIFQLWGGDIIRPRQYRVRPNSCAEHDVKFLSGLLHDGIIRSISRKGRQYVVQLTRDTWECIHSTGCLESFESELQLSRVTGISTTSGSLDRLLKRPGLMIESVSLEFEHLRHDRGWRLLFDGRDARNRRWNLTFTIRNEYDVVLNDFRKVE